ncbi:transposase [Cyanobacterium aponinum FACHB-4101]|uniref:RNA-guided endonuclease InsQ/TnpB family protein n=1 Tax=Cyanobacterium aponinum TaxID=379064 RepID=UPI0016817F8E|nr:RNA-guided endonuclease TnpB family protein [Cyanobacterium aponinum]MBD2395393.1 transposase [Cyanobacterium aponinum FACHB-4101]
MFILEYKLRGKPKQFEAIDEGIRTVQFIRNKCVRYWMDSKSVGKSQVYKHTTTLRNEYPFVKNLNSTACQQAGERAWSAISKFYDNCKKQIKGKKGYPQFSKRTRSIEYKKSGWKLDRDDKRITFTDGNNIGTLKLIGSRDLYYFQEFQIQRVRIVRRADGYFCQFCLKLDVRDITPELPQTQKMVGIDVGLNWYYADSDGNFVKNPRYYRKAEKKLNRLNRLKSRKFKKGKPVSQNYLKAKKRYGKAHLKVSRQRVEFAKSLALRLIQSNDLIAYEDLKVKNLVRNSKLAKSINDAGWSELRKWIEYFGVKYRRLSIAVTPNYTSQDCFNCGKRIKKSLSTRTHVCSCGYIANRDTNASLNILRKATEGHSGSWSELLDLNAWGDLSSTVVGSNTCHSKTNR